MGYIWQKYDDAVPEYILRGFALPEQVLSGSTVIEKAYRRPDGNGEVIGWHFDVTLRQPFDDSRYPVDRHEVWLRMWHADFDRNVVLTPDLDAYESTREGETFGVDFAIVPGGWEINETLFEYKVGHYDTDFGISNYFGQEDFLEFHFTVVVEWSFGDAFVITLVPLLIVAGLLFAILMITTADPERAETFGFNMAGGDRHGIRPVLRGALGAHPAAGAVHRGRGCLPRAVLFHDLFRHSGGDDRRVRLLVRGARPIGRARPTS